jgi:CheY-like chemotaxis protein
MGAKKRILYIEYDPLVAARCHALLVAGGYMVGVVMSGRQALNILKSDIFDLLIVSNTIPAAELDEIAVATRNHAPQLPLLLLENEHIRQLSEIAQSAAADSLLDRVERLLALKDAPPKF